MGLDVDTIRERKEGRRGPDCYCGAPSVLRKGSNGYFYGCSMWPECEGAVGCHPETTRPLGSLADSETREARHLAHKVFDSLWEAEDGPSRGGAYAWLSTVMGLPPEDCHIGKFDLDQSKKVVVLASQITPAEVSAWLDEVEGKFDQVRRKHLRELKKDMGP